MSLVELLSLVRSYNFQNQCSTGLFLELKSPAFHRKEGLPTEEALLFQLAEIENEIPVAYSSLSSSIKKYSKHYGVDGFVVNEPDVAMHALRKRSPCGGR